MRSEELIESHRRGWIPGPDESEEQFRRRIQSVSQTPPAPRLKELFDLDPQDIPLVFSDEGLAPWQGAVTRVYEENGILRSEVQLREAFRSGQSLRFYSFDEVWAHEATHAARCAFDEPKWEEWFAYRSSPSRWRRLLGPLIERPIEVWVFLSALLISEASWFAFDSLWAWLPLLLIIGVAGWRLAHRHQIFDRAKRNVATLLKEAEKAEAFLFRLRDAEIESFAKWDAERIRDYAENQSCLRWQLLREVYLCGQST